VAEEFAMVDALTGGRVVAGMLRGTSNEYVTYATNPAESRERFEEALELIVRAWTTPQPFGWQGRYYEYRAISIWPRPIQQPHPPIFMSGSSPESGELAARRHLSLGLAFTTIPLARKAVAYYRGRADEYGWQPGPDQVLYRLMVHVAATDQQATDDVIAAGANERRGGYSIANRVVDETVASLGYYGRDTDVQRDRLRPHDLAEKIALGQLVVGSPATVLAQMVAVAEQVGCGILDLQFQPVGHQQMLTAIELFGREVLPRLQQI
jgi:alkanesulfonate monooxygenase SsuD/methylene tetrahydromethanopterin reductase-like flavin-dependent oxidoreductase (luciferase family)